MINSHLFCDVIRDNPQSKSSRPQMFFEIGVLENFAIFTGKHLYRSLFLLELQALRTYKKETPTQVFSCECCKIFMKAFLEDASGGCF